MAGTYAPVKAQAKATVRRKASKYQGMKVVDSPPLQDFIEQALGRHQSPAAIAGRLATGLDGLTYASKNSIYRFVGSGYGRQIEHQRTLLKRQTRARRRKPQAERLRDRNFIDARPEVITRRERVGDLEADFIVSGKSGSGVLLTAVDRKLRVGFIRLILPVTIANVEQAFADIQQVFPELSSLTLDNDILFRFHQRLAVLLGVPIYFTEPYASWQKGSIENYNKQVRKYVPKGADISRYSLKYVEKTEHRLNGRFMKLLDFQTPDERLEAYRKKAGRENTPLDAECSA